MIRPESFSLSRISAGLWSPNECFHMIACGLWPLTLTDLCSVPQLNLCHWWSCAGERHDRLWDATESITFSLYHCHRRSRTTCSTNERRTQPKTSRVHWKRAPKGSSGLWKLCAVHRLGLSVIGMDRFDQPDKYLVLYMIVRWLMRRCLYLFVSDSSLCLPWASFSEELMI